MANPPCVIGPGIRYANRDSGTELDGFRRKIVGQAPEFLEEGGLFQSAAEWPGLTGVDWKERMAGWFRNSGCAADGASRQEALANAEIVIGEWIETARGLGRPVPEPKGRLLYA